MRATLAKVVLVAHPARRQLNCAAASRSLARSLASPKRRGHTRLAAAQQANSHAQSEQLSRVERTKHSQRVASQQCACSPGLQSVCAPLGP